MRCGVCSIALIMLMFGVTASTAAAATLTTINGTLTYAADPGHLNQVALDEGPPGTVQVRRLAVGAGDDDPIVATGCTENVAGSDYTCAGVTAVVGTAGDGDDILDASGVQLGSAGLSEANARLDGGGGADELAGGAQADELRGGGTRSRPARGAAPARSYMGCAG